MSTLAFGHGMASTDGKGHGHSTKADVPPVVAGTCAAIVASGKWPYRTMADMVRDGLVRLLDDLHDADPESVPGYEFVQIVVDLERRTAQRRDEESMIQQYDQLMHYASDAQEMEQIRDEMKMMLSGNHISSWARNELSHRARVDW